MVWIALFVLGIITGSIAGLLGIGGGILVVPGLAFIFRYMDVPDDRVMHYAIATSLMIMIVTSSAALVTRAIKKDISWKVILRSFGGVIIGSILGAYCVTLLKSDWLRLIFAFYLLCISIRMFVGFKNRRETPHHSHPVLLFFLGVLIAFKSGLTGTGAGAIIVPFLFYFGFSMRTAAGTTSVFSLIIAICASVTFLVTKGDPSDIPWSAGYIYWPAFFVVGSMCLIFAPLGAWLSSFFSNKLLSKIFAVILFLISIKMFWG